MAREIKRKQIAKNISLSLLAQVVSLMVSFVLGFIVPKIVDEYQYAYWHTYLLYVSYVGVLHFGLLDGLVLRYSQYDYEELDKLRIRSQFAILLAISSIGWLVLFFIGSKNNGVIQTIITLVAFGILTKNILTYNSFLFQITNRINEYAFVTIVQKIIYVILILLFILLKNNNYIWLCIADLLGDCAAIGFSLMLNKGLNFGKILPVKEALKEAWLNISSGILLMIANWSSMLLIGVAKMFVEWKWGSLLFGKTSFAFSVANLILTFVTAISVVLFPLLKRMKQESLPSFYKRLRDMITPLLFWGLLLYFPECWVLESWLPKYSSSLVYLGILSPLIVYLSLVSLLTNNYLKAYRKESWLLYVNMISVVLAASFYGICAYWSENLIMLLIAVVLVVMLRSIASEIAVMKLINLDLKKEFIIEFFMTCAFIVSAQCFSKIGGFLFYIVFLMVYSYINLDGIKAIASQVSVYIMKKR